MSVDMDPREIWKIIGGNRRFADPFSDFPGYYIIGTETPGEEVKARYIEKLSYAADNADILIEAAFRPEYFGFYGVDQKAAGSPEEMCRRLVFDSFVLDVQNASVGTCLSNDEFMFGHYIECWWNGNWQVIYSLIC